MKQAVCRAGIFAPTLLALLLLLGGCSVNPATGGANVVFSSASGEASVGREMYDELVAEGAVYDDPDLQAYVTREPGAISGMCRWPS